MDLSTLSTLLSERGTEIVLDKLVENRSLTEPEKGVLLENHDKPVLWAVNRKFCSIEAIEQALTDVLDLES